MSNAAKKVNVGIVGARGYSGLELARILLRHPEVELKAVFASEANWKLTDYLEVPANASVQVLPMSALGEAASELQTVFLATPVEVSLELAPKLLKQGTQVIDLSGAFRLEAAAFHAAYGQTHSAPELLERARYGLVPWCGPSSGRGGADRASLIANPGCFATAALMALLPLLKAGLVNPHHVVIDAKSGTSGAGRKAAENLLFTEVDGECLPYRVGKHQHLPEIERYLAHWGGIEMKPHFSTHLLPVRRGITAAIYAETSASAEQIEATFQTAYAGYPLISFSSTRTQLLSLKRVVGTPRTHVYFTVQGEKLYLFSAIDNLLKGAASQAVENLNCLLDLPLSTGLATLEALT